MLAAHVREQARRVLGLGADQLDIHAGLIDLGLNSLTAIEFRNSLQGSLSCTLPVTMAFDNPTIDAVVDYLANLMLAPAAEPLASAPSTPAPADTLDALSEDEVAGLLAAKLSALEELP